MSYQNDPSRGRLCDEIDILINNKVERSHLRQGVSVCGFLVWAVYENLEMRWSSGSLNNNYAFAHINKNKN